MTLKETLISYIVTSVPKKIIDFFQIYRSRLNFTLNNLIDKGLEINVVYDIGAYHGNWSNNLRKTCLKNRIFYLFEANKKNESFLKNKKFQYFIGILSNKIKKVNFYSKNHSGDSYFLENTKFYKKNLKPKKILTNTLDNIIKQNNLPLADFIKIDTQGSEIDILKGSTKSLKNCKIIYLECPIVRYNHNAPNLSEYINYMNKIKYLPYDICEIHYIDKVLVQIDIIFLKKNIFKKYLLNKKHILKLLD